jgi:hypothetical protein
MEHEFVFLTCSCHNLSSKGQLGLLFRRKMLLYVWGLSSRKKTALFQKVAPDWLELNFVIIRLDRFSQWETNSCLGEEVDSNPSGDEATHSQSIGNQHPAGKQGAEFGGFQHGVVLKGIPAFTEHFHPSCHCAIWQRSIATCFTQSLKQSCALRPRATSIFIQERCSSFLNLSLGRLHYPPALQSTAQCNWITYNCHHSLHYLISQSVISFTKPTAIWLTSVTW